MIMLFSENEKQFNRKRASVGWLQKLTIGKPVSNV